MRMESCLLAEGTVTEKLCAVVELQSEIIRAQHDVIRQLGGDDPTEGQTAQADAMSRELCGDIFDL